MEDSPWSECGADQIRAAIESATQALHGSHEQQSRDAAEALRPLCSEGVYKSIVKDIDQGSRIKSILVDPALHHVLAGFSWGSIQVILNPLWAKSSVIVVYETQFEHDDSIGKISMPPITNKSLAGEWLIQTP